MRVDPERQLARAAGLAGLLPPTATAEQRAHRIAQGIAPTIAAAIATEIDRLRALLAERDREEREILAACRSVGDAVDRLEQHRHTSAEIPARRALEQAAVRLRRAIQRKDAHGSP